MSNTNATKKPTGQTHQEFISRNNLAKRWDKSVEFIKHKERAGELQPFRFGYRSVGYRLQEVIELEENMTS